MEESKTGEIAAIFAGCGETKSPIENIDAAIEKTAALLAGYKGVGAALEATELLDRLYRMRVEERARIRVKSIA